jgi:hypothetical protein
MARRAEAFLRPCGFPAGSSAKGAAAEFDGCRDERDWGARTMSDNWFTKFRTCAIVFPMDEFDHLSGLKRGRRDRHAGEALGTGTGADFFIWNACNPLKSLDSEK